MERGLVGDRKRLKDPRGADAATEAKGRYMGPFNFPWMTFMAFVVTGASVVIALVWALRGRDRQP